GRRFARAHHAVDFHQGFELSPGGVIAQSVGHKGAAVEVVGVDDLNGFYVGIGKLLKTFCSQFSIAFKQQLAGFFIDNIFGENTTVEVFDGNLETVDAIGLQLTNVLGGNPAAFFNNNLAAFAFDVKTGNFTAQPFRLQVHGIANILLLKDRGFKKHIEDFGGVIAESPQQNRRRQLAAAVYTDKYLILGIKFKIQP